MRKELLFHVVLLINYWNVSAYTESCENVHHGTPNLKYDEALLYIEDNSQESASEKTFNAISTLCYQCDLQPCTAFRKNVTVKVTTRFAYRYSVTDSSGKTICSYQFHFEEHGEYKLSITPEKKCLSIRTVNDPIRTYIPLAVMFGTFVAMALLHSMYEWAVRKYHISQAPEGYESIIADDPSFDSESKSSAPFSSKYGSVPPDPHIKPKRTQTSLNSRTRLPARLASLDTFRGSTNVTLGRSHNNDEQSEHLFSRSHTSEKSYGSTASKSTPEYQRKYMGGVTFNTRTSVMKRLKSLDTFRGISIVVMIFVNYGGGKYWFFNHSKWNGLTVADLVFPWFIFIMGSSIFISCRSMRRKSIPKKTVTWKIIIRTIKLFALGLFINNGVDLANWRIPGVLQRFAFSYFVVAMLNVWLSPDEDKVDIHYHYDWRDAIRDLTWFPAQHIIMLILTAVYLCLTFLLPVSGCPTGYLGPGGLSESGKHKDCTGGAAAYIDKKFFGIDHIYNHPTCTYPYECSVHDPEGLLGVIPSILLTYFGVMAARVLFMYSRPKSHVRRWLIWSVILGCAAIALCEGKQDGGLIPINKNLWSLSFIFATGGMAFFLLTICYILIDVMKLWSGAPFYFAGMNSIMLYCGHEILAGYFPFNFKNNGQHEQLLAQASVGTLVWVLIAYYCFKRNVFWKV